MKLSTRHSLKMVLGATALSTILMSGAYAQTVNITILGIGDIYDFDEDDGRGGVARVNAIALAERAANPIRFMCLMATCFRLQSFPALTKARI